MTACRTALLCLLLALLAPVGAGAAEDTVREPTLLAPQPGDLITGPFAVHVVTPPETGGLELRALRGDTVLTGPDRVVDSTVTAGERHWRKRLDLSSLPNGLVTVQVRPVAATPGADTAWTGVVVLLSALPAAPTLSVAPGPDAGSVTATWEALVVPDLLEARLERAGPDEETFAVEGVLDAAALARGGQRVLTGLVPGEHRLRLTTARAGHDGPLEAVSDIVTVPVEPAAHDEPADESPEPTPEPPDTRVRATGGSEPRQVNVPAPAEAQAQTESAPSTPREHNAAMRRTASSQEVSTTGPQVAAPQVAAPQVAAPETAPPERSSAAQVLARPPAATLTIGHPDRLVEAQTSVGPLLALLLAGFMLARRTRRSARR